MRRKVHSTIALLGFLALCTVSRASALDPLMLPPQLKEALDQQRRKPLGGLPGVMITIEYMYPDITREGVSGEHLRQLVTELVRDAGIKTATVEDCAMHVSNLRKRLGEYGQLDRKVLTEGPCAFGDLYLNVNAHRIPEGLVYSVRLQILEDVLLQRDPSMIIQAVTWDRGGTGIGNVGDILRAVNQLVRSFIEDYMAANPM